ncbi:MAG: thymidine phosphorylase, partial [Clostridia bacterium]|nr:thymidine phosphorylase [Clostridia bacterium]
MDAPVTGALRVDNHSTGGLGYKTSLVVAPIVASLGLTVAKMSGRGLGHTGGTVDKLEAIPGFRTDLSADAFRRVVETTGIAIVGQSSELAPADKLLYALRDVTATVDSLPLIASSIMGKKLAADDDCIVLDVKTGSGAFMKTLADSRALAEAMVDIGKRAGKRICALITDMDRPLGRAVGNSLEVIEAIETLRGEGAEDLTALCVALAARMLYLADRGTLDECEAMVREAISSGAAMEKLVEMVTAQGGDASYILHTERFTRARCQRTVTVPCNGYIASVDTEQYGVASLLLGAGRSRKEDAIDLSAGFYLHAKTGDCVRHGDALVTLYSTNAEALDAAERTILGATRFSDHAPEARPLIFDICE